jgi:hypothetical protein
LGINLIGLKRSRPISALHVCTYAPYTSKPLDISDSYINTESTKDINDLVIGVTYWDDGDGDDENTVDLFRIRCLLKKIDLICIHQIKIENNIKINNQYLLIRHILIFPHTHNSNIDIICITGGGMIIINQLHGNIDINISVNNSVINTFEVFNRFEFMLESGSAISVQDISGLGGKQSGVVIVGVEAEYMLYSSNEHSGDVYFSSSDYDGEGSNMDTQKESQDKTVGVKDETVGVKDETVEVKDVVWKVSEISIHFFFQFSFCTSIHQSTHVEL